MQQAVLENYKDSILLLRAKYASYEKISELLNERGVKVSVATVRKFCRKYQDEAQRLRAEIAADSGTERQAYTTANRTAERRIAHHSPVSRANADRAPPAINFNHGEP